MSCAFLIKDGHSRNGYYCRCVSPCPYLERDIDCPCVDLAREFEISIRSPAYIEIRTRTVTEACKDVTVIR